MASKVETLVVWARWSTHAIIIIATLKDVLLPASRIVSYQIIKQSEEPPLYRMRTL